MINLIQRYLRKKQLKKQIYFFDKKINLELQVKINKICQKNEQVLNRRE